MMEKWDCTMAKLGCKMAKLDYRKAKLGCKMVRSVQMEWDSVVLHRMDSHSGN